MAWFPAAVIFDMDGVLINSEPLWRIAMVKAFKEYGMPATEEECRQTMGMRIGEVIKLWVIKYGKPATEAPGIERRVMELLLQLIEEKGKALEGVPEMLLFCRQHGIRCGLATSSSEQLMEAVLNQLDIKDFFAATHSAEKLTYGKPHPEVFLRCAGELNVSPENCIVIEDSLNGVVAAKAASMKVIAVPDDEIPHSDDLRDRQFSLADHRAPNMKGALSVLKNLCGFGV